jgi:hypothetical protein
MSERQSKRKKGPPGLVFKNSPEKVKSPTKNVDQFKDLYFSKFTGNKTARELQTRFEVIQSTIGKNPGVEMCTPELLSCDKPPSRDKSHEKHTIECMLKHEESTKDNIPQYEFSMVSNLADKEADHPTFTSTVTEKTVCRIKNQVVKKTKFNSEHPRYNVEFTLFLLILEITIQNYVHDLSLKDLIVPKITDYYFDADKAEVTMIMKYVDTEPLSYDNYPKCIEILQHLKDNYSIFHNDTHSDNIRQTKDGKIVMLDWGKGNLINNNPSITGLYKGMTEPNGFAEWLNSKNLLKPVDTTGLTPKAKAKAIADAQKYVPENSNPIFGGRKSKRKWSMKYKKSINCRNPKGFSQKQYCKYGRKTHGRKTHTHKIKKSRFL